MQTVLDESYVKYLYYRIKERDIRVSYIPAEDVLQEIRIAILLANDDKYFNHANNAVYHLLCAYGYSKKKGKDSEFSDFDTESISEDSWRLIDMIEDLYRIKGYSAKQIAIIFDIQYSNNLKKALFNLFPKNMGRGGNRKNGKFTNYNPHSSDIRLSDEEVRQP